MPQPLGNPDVVYMRNLPAAASEQFMMLLDPRLSGGEDSMPQDTEVQIGRMQLLRYGFPPDRIRQGISESTISSAVLDLELLL